MGTIKPEEVKIRNQWISGIAPQTKLLQNRGTISVLKTEEELIVETRGNDDEPMMSDDDAASTTSSDAKRSTIVVNRLPDEPLGLEIDIKRSVGAENLILGVFISRVTSGGAAQRSANSVGKPLRRGDELVSVNDRVLRLCNHAEVVEVFNEMPLAVRLDVSRASRASTPSYSSRSTPANITFEEMLAKRKLSEYSVDANGDDDDDEEDDDEDDDDDIRSTSYDVNYSDPASPVQNGFRRDIDLEPEFEGQGNFAFQTCKTNYLLEDFDSRRVILRKKVTEDLGLKFEPVTIYEHKYFKVVDISPSSIFSKRPLIFIGDILVSFNEKRLKNLDNASCEKLFSIPTDTVCLEFLRSKKAPGFCLFPEHVANLDDKKRSSQSSIIFDDIGEQIASKNSSAKLKRDGTFENSTFTNDFSEQSKKEDALNPKSSKELERDNDAGDLDWYQMGSPAGFRRRADLQKYKTTDDVSNLFDLSNFETKERTNVIPLEYLDDSHVDKIKNAKNVANDPASTSGNVIKSPTNLIDFDSLEEEFPSQSSDDVTTKDVYNFVNNKEPVFPESFENQARQDEGKKEGQEPIFVSSATAKLKTFPKSNTINDFGSPLPTPRRTRKISGNYNPYTHMSIETSKIGTEELNAQAKSFDNSINDRITINEADKEQNRTNSDTSVQQLHVRNFSPDARIRQNLDPHVDYSYTEVDRSSSGVIHRSEQNNPEAGNYLRDDDLADTYRKSSRGQNFDISARSDISQSNELLSNDDRSTKNINSSFFDDEEEFTDNFSNSTVDHENSSRLNNSQISDRIPLPRIGSLKKVTNIERDAVNRKNHFPERGRINEDSIDLLNYSDKGEDILFFKDYKPPNRDDIINKIDLGEFTPPYNRQNPNPRSSLKRATEENGYPKEEYRIKNQFKEPKNIGNFAIKIDDDECSQPYSRQYPNPRNSIKRPAQTASDNRPANWSREIHKDDSNSYDFAIPRLTTKSAHPDFEIQSSSTPDERLFQNLERNSINREFNDSVLGTNKEEVSEPRNSRSNYPNYKLESPSTPSTLVPRNPEDKQHPRLPNLSASTNQGASIKQNNPRSTQPDYKGSKIISDTHLSKNQESDRHDFSVDQENDQQGFHVNRDLRDSVPRNNSNNNEGAVILAKNLLALLTSDCIDSSVEVDRSTTAGSDRRRRPGVEVSFPTRKPVDLGAGPAVEIFGVNTDHASVVYIFKGEVEERLDGFETLFAREN